nr:unnamed protein product [Ipomoea batatas]
MYDKIKPNQSSIYVFADGKRRSEEDGIELKLKPLALCNMGLEALDLGFFRFGFLGTSEGASVVGCGPSLQHSGSGPDCTDSAECAKNCLNPKPNISLPSSNDTTRPIESLIQIKCPKFCQYCYKILAINSKMRKVRMNGVASLPIIQQNHLLHSPDRSKEHESHGRSLHTPALLQHHSMAQKRQQQSHNRVQEPHSIAFCSQLRLSPFVEENQSIRILHVS